MLQPFIEKPVLEPDTTTSYPDFQTAGISGVRMDHFISTPFSRLFESQVSQNPERVAVICDDAQITFAELNARANQVARYLRDLGVGRESLVGICIDRSLDMAVGIIGILKAGAAYLPLDPDYPSARLAFMVDDARPAFILTKALLQGVLPKCGIGSGLVLLDDDWPRIAEQSSANLDDGPCATDLAYVIYTSGSTGDPKGVMITHANLANYLLALNHELHINSDDLYLHVASIAFSSSRRQLMLPLSQGAGVVIASAAERKDPIALFEMIQSQGVTVMDAVPSFLRNTTTILESLDDERRRTLLENRLRLILTASEPLLSDLPRIWGSTFQHSAHHVHMFGQTETAGIVALYHIPDDINGDVSVIPIGSPIANTDIYILDDERKPCAEGVAGELYIGGAGVGRGYLNRPDLTAQKFINHPFAGPQGTRLYRTGDWARSRADGRLECVGRSDQQVKLRGFRVELGEIEATLVKHPSIRESVVAVRDVGGDRKLVAYFVGNGGPVKAFELRNFLSAQLPDYEVPSNFVELDALPLSANGKVNRLALPGPSEARSFLSTEFNAPQNELEVRLASIWSEVLHAETVGRDDNFFELGGHSLIAAQIVARVRSVLRVEIPLTLVFEQPTIALMAKAIAETSELATSRIEKFNRNETAPLSFTQQQFWLLDQSALTPSAYNVCVALSIRGRLIVEKLEQAIQAVVDRHEVLRTRIAVHGDSPVQVIADSAAMRVERHDISHLATDEAEAEIERALLKEAHQPFDLTHGPLLRTRLFTEREDSHTLLITLHHIVCDGWAVNLLLREIAIFYDAAVKNCEADLPQLPIQYADFALWQRRWMQRPEVDLQLDYWKRRLANPPAYLDLPTDYRRPAETTLDGARLSMQLSPALSSELKALAQRQGATLFMTLLAAFQTFLFRYTGEEDILVGSPVAGRTMLETENLVGAFVNTVIFRGDLSNNPSFIDFLARVRETTIGALSHQDVPFEKLIEELKPARSANRSPLFQVMFTLQNSPEFELAVQGLEITRLNPVSATSKFDLSLDVADQHEALELTFEYSRDLFEPATVKRMLGHFQILLEAIVSDPSQGLTELSILSEAERIQTLIDWNSKRLEVPKDAAIHQLFEAQVIRTPDRVAAEFQGQRLSYRELNARANKLAHHLRKRGVRAENLVGLCIERSLDTLVGILGVLKAGGGYVPLDRTYPSSRISSMAADAGLSLVVTRKNLVANLPRACSFICLDDDRELIDMESDENPIVNVTPNNIAYVIYTSGSSGTPKGTMIEHQSLVNFAHAASSTYGIDENDRVLQFASLSFDLSVEEIFPAILTGATVVLRTEEMIDSITEFVRCCDAWNLTVLDLPTAYWHELTDALARERNLVLPESTRLVIIGGEKASADRVFAWQRLIGDRVRLVNTYGPTEATVAVTVCDLTERPNDSSDVIPIGRPMANTSLYVLDHSLQPVPLGVAGELYIGGPGVARGYLNQPELTAAKFISDPFNGAPGARLYKTGDLVRYLANGEIEFLGRADNQIKIRGFRVELEEIEKTLRNYAGVADCVVVLREGDDKRLAAYVVLDGNPPSVPEIREYLKTKLPSYMLPATFTFIDSLPLMPNGKIDRRALPEPEAATELDDAFVGPSTPIEELLASAWREVLGLERISVHDNFFDLGGHSLLAARVVSVVRNQMNVPFGMVDIFQSPTIAELEALLYPRVVQEESESELAALLAEVANLSDEEANDRIALELQV